MKHNYDGQSQMVLASIIADFSISLMLSALLQYMSVMILTPFCSCKLKESRSCCEDNCYEQISADLLCEVKSCIRGAYFNQAKLIDGIHCNEKRDYCYNLSLGQLRVVAKTC